ncbi:MAG: septum formation protein Maf [Rhodothermales bacterium]|nr:septum formation protein Maf [Rhodothermales bacterium]
MNLSVPLVLASASPRRRTILELSGATFEVIPSGFEEHALDSESPDEMVVRLSAGKARDISSRRPDALVIGADTIVVLDGEILEKPEDAEHAVRMLSRLSGRTHTVKTGVTLVHDASERLVSFLEQTHVTFSPLTRTQIHDYVSTGSPLDKAGGYGIQDEGALFVERIEGDFYTVMGLPLNRLHRELYSSFPDALLHAGSESVTS